MIFTPPEWLLVGAVAAVGVLHTMVPDHWVPITLIGRQRGWTRGQTARAALLAGTGHVLSTLAIAVVVWIAGAVAARSFGRWIDAIASAALVAFGGWIAVSALIEMRREEGHGHGPEHHHHHGDHDDRGRGREHGRSQGKASSRTALLLILGSSPMIEGIPAFFAAGRYGAPLIVVMSLVFAAATIVTYVTLCVASLAGLERVSLGPLERYGEVISGAFIALVGVVFWLWPML